MARHGWLVALASVIVLLPLYVATAAPTLSSRNGGDDGGDLAVAASALSVAHPPGYPLFVMLGWCWIHVVSFGDAAYRLNLLSALSAALAIGLAVWASWEFVQLARPATQPTGALVASGAAGLLLGLSGPVWGQAVVVSVYTLNLALSAGLLGLTFRAQRTGPTTRGAILFGAVLGVGLGNHVSLTFVGLAAAAAAFCERWPWRVWAGALLGLVPTLVLVYAYLLLGNVAARDPIGAWGDPATPPGFLALVTAQLYHGLVGRPPLGQVLQRVVRAISLSLGVLRPLGMLAAVVGATNALRARSSASLAIFVAPAFLALAALLFAVTYGGARGEHHLLPVYLALTPLVAVGLADLLGQATGGLLRAGAGAAILGLLVYAGWSSRGVIAAGDRTDVDSARQQLLAQPTNGRLYPVSDAQTFSLWYAQEDLGTRPDVAIIHRGLWQTSASYRAKLQARHSWLAAGNPS